MLDVEKPDVVVEALVVSLAVIPAFHVKVFPFAMVATNTSPKLLNDQRPGSSVTVAAFTASPHPLKSVALVTVAPSACIAGEVPFVL